MSRAGGAQRERERARVRVRGAPRVCVCGEMSGNGASAWMVVHGRVQSSSGGVRGNVRGGGSGGRECVRGEVQRTRALHACARACICVCAHACSPRDRHRRGLMRRAAPPPVRCRPYLDSENSTEDTIFASSMTAPHCTHTDSPPDGFVSISVPSHRGHLGPTLAALITFAFTNEAKPISKNDPLAT